MGKLIIKGTNVYDGEWDFDQSYFTNGEYHVIYQRCGVAAGELFDALDRGHVGLICALAACALERLGKIVDFQIILDSKELPAVRDDAEDDASPPVLPSGDDKSSDAAEKSSSSGRSGSNGSESKASDPSRTGTGSSDASQTSEPQTSGT